MALSCGQIFPRASALITNQFILGGLEFDARECMCFRWEREDKGLVHVTYYLYPGWLGWLG